MKLTFVPSSSGSAKKPDVEMFLLGSLDYIEGDGYYLRNDNVGLSAIPTETVLAYYRALADSGNIQPHAATKILKRSFVLENNLTFKEGILSEDYEWMFRLLRCLESVSIFDEPLYIYRVGREGSVTNTVSRKSVEDLLGIVASSLSFYKGKAATPLKDFELGACSYLWFIALGLSSQLGRNEACTVAGLFNSTSAVCPYSRSHKTRLAYAVYRLLGASAASFVLGAYISLGKMRAINRTKVRHA